MADLPLSVLIPSYNYGQFIGEAIESVLSQAFGDFELIVIDNASTDSTAEVVRSYRDRRLRLIVNAANEGSYYSTRRFFEEANGRYLRALCADDVLIADVLAEQVTALDRYSNVGLVTCDMLITDAALQNGRLMKMYRGYSRGDAVAVQSLRTLENLIGGPSNYMYRRESIRRFVLDQSYRYIGDLKFGMSLIAGCDFVNIDRPGYYYRRHEGSDTNLNCPPAVQAQEWLRLNIESATICHLNCLALLRRPLPASEKQQLRRWLVRHMFDSESLLGSFQARKKQWIQRNM